MTTPSQSTECLGDGVCTNPRCERHGVQVGAQSPEPLRVALEKQAAIWEGHTSDNPDVAAGFELAAGKLRELLAGHPVEPAVTAREPEGKAAEELSTWHLGLSRAEIRDEVDELIRNAYAEGWRESKQRPDEEPPLLDINWTRARGVLITELWCECEIDPDRRLLRGPHHEVNCLRYVNGPARPPEAVLNLLRGTSVPRSSE